MDFGLAAIADELDGDASAQRHAGLHGAGAAGRARGDACRAISTRSAWCCTSCSPGKLPFDGQRSARAAAAARVASRHHAVDARFPKWVRAVERAILRCLEPDPKLRPASALEVAASLPGGDPLAEALAAGETPSPEMVGGGRADRGPPAREGGRPSRRARVGLVSVLCYAKVQMLDDASAAEFAGGR